MMFMDIPTYEAVDRNGVRYTIAVAISYCDSTLRIIIGGKEYIVKVGPMHHGRYYMQYGKRGRSSKTPITIGEAVEWLAEILGLVIVDQDVHLDLWGQALP